MNIKISSELGKHLGTTLLPAGKKSFSIKRFEKGLILKKEGNIIELEDYELDRLFDSIMWLKNYKEPEDNIQ